MPEAVVADVVDRLPEGVLEVVVDMVDRIAEDLGAAELDPQAARSAAAARTPTTALRRGVTALDPPDPVMLLCVLIVLLLTMRRKLTPAALGSKKSKNSLGTSRDDLMGTHPQ
jgi:hypothetical protein